MSPIERITAYFDACSRGSAADIAAHFTTDAVIYDTNVRPTRGDAEIGLMWVRVRERWGGARWTVDSAVVADDPAPETQPPAEDVRPQRELHATERVATTRRVAAIEWSMTGRSTAGRAFTFRGSEHYHFENTLIDEIRQYWTFDPDNLDTGLVGFDYD